MENKQTLTCPFQKIDINNKRQIINCDKLSFPWNQDPNGYFLVKIKEDAIFCGFVNQNHEMIIELRGKNPDKIIKEILKRNFCNKENVAYIASELMIAFNCINNGEKYIQR